MLFTLRTDKNNDEIKRKICMDAGRSHYGVAEERNCFNNNYNLVFTNKIDKT